MLILREPRAVKARRGLLLPLFQRANLDAFYPELERYTSILVKQIEAEQKAQGNVDVFRWLRLVAFDIIGGYSYEHLCGWNIEMLTLVVLQGCSLTVLTWR